MPKKPTTYEFGALKELYATWLISAIISCMLVVIASFIAISVGPLSHIPDQISEKITSPESQQVTTSSIPYIPVNISSTMVISNDSKLLVFDLIETAPDNIANIVISSVDFARNTFTPAFISNTEDQSNIQENKQYPLITDSVGANDRILNLLDGHTDCRNLNSILHGATTSVWSCAVAIPPSSYQEGESFGGFMTVMFQKRLDFQDEDRFLNKMRFTARIIYEKDVHEN